MDTALIIDVEPRAGHGVVGDSDVPVVVVEPLLGGPAVVAALDLVDDVQLDAASGEVPHLRALMDGDVPGDATVMRLPDLVHALNAEAAMGAQQALIVSYLNLRPCAALLGSWVSQRSDISRIRIACASVRGDTDAIGADAVHLAGALARMLLEEIDLPVMLSEAAGIAMTVAQSAEQAGAVMEAGRRWSLLRDNDGIDPETPHMAGQADLCGVVPVVAMHGDRLVAAAWRPQVAHS